MAEYILGFVLYGEQVFQGTYGAEVTEICSSIEEVEDQLISILERSRAPGTREEIAGRVRRLRPLQGSLHLKRTSGGRTVIGGAGPFVVVFFDDKPHPFFAVFGPGGLFLPISETSDEAMCLADALNEQFKAAVAAIRRDSALPTP